jgi:hypothetical protein
MGTTMRRALLMSATSSNNLVSANQVQRFRSATGLPVMECKRFLASLSPTDRSAYIELAESQPGRPLHDPIQDDPAIRPLFLAASEEAAREANEWHRQRMAELERESPSVAALFRSGRGLCYVVWARTKELMKERHGIDWRSPKELNPLTRFD